MDRNPQPPWYRLHFVTWLAILVVGGGLGWGSFENVRKQFPYQRSLHLGWPLVAGVVIDKSNRKTQPAGTLRVYRWRKFGSIFDVTVAIFILGSTGFAVERRLRAEMRWQIRLTTLLSGTAVVAAALCCAQDGRTIFLRLAKWVGEPSPLFVDISFRSWAVKLPILFGLACTIYVLGRMNIWLIGLALRLSFKNQRGEGRKSIADEWNVQQWPTFYLIDHNGIIRGRWLASSGDEVLDSEVNELVEESEAQAEK